MTYESLDCVNLGFIREHCCVVCHHPKVAELRLSKGTSKILVEGNEALVCCFVQEKLMKEKTA